MAHTWIKTNIWFDDRTACFLLPKRDALTNCDKEMLEAMWEFKNKENIDVLEGFVLKLIERYRPDLKGSMIHAISYSLVAMRWEFLLSHPSLPKRKQGEALPPMPLIPEEGVRFIHRNPWADKQELVAAMVQDAEEMLADEPITVN